MAVSPTYEAQERYGDSVRVKPGTVQAARPDIEEFCGCWNTPDGSARIRVVSVEIIREELSQRFRAELMAVCNQLASRGGFSRALDTDTRRVQWPVAENRAQPSRCPADGTFRNQECGRGSVGDRSAYDCIFWRNGGRVKDKPL